jgi:autotransporter adhesin
LGSERTITHVAAGRLSIDSTDAINGSQLYATNQAIEKLSHPYIDGVGVGAPAQATGLGSVALGFGSVADTAQSVSVGNAATGLIRRITNVGSGLAETDAVNVGQMNGMVTAVKLQLADLNAQLNQNSAAIASIDTSAGGSHTLLAAANPAGSAGTLVGASALDTDAIHYDASNHAAITLSSLKGDNVSLSGLQNGALTASSTDAVTGQQLFATNQQVASINQAVQNISMTGTTAVSANSTSGVAAASGTQAIAVGGGAIASGANATALGDKASASGSNAVAIGANSLADRDNAVSVGAVGSERQITNVATGTSGTDAINLNQLNSAIAQQSNAVGQQISNLQGSINTVSKNAYAGVAAAMAMPSLTPSGPGRTLVAAGGGYYMGGSAAAVGVTYRSANSHWLVNGAVSVTSVGNPAVRTQVGYEF